MIRRPKSFNADKSILQGRFIRAEFSSAVLPPFSCFSAAAQIRTWHEQCDMSMSRSLNCFSFNCCIASQASPLPPHACSVLQARVSLEGVSLFLSDIRVVDGKFACYRITVTPATGARWEVRLGWAGRARGCRVKRRRACVGVCRFRHLTPASSPLVLLCGCMCRCGEWWFLCQIRRMVLRRCFLLQRLRQGIRMANASPTLTRLCDTATTPPPRLPMYTLHVAQGVERLSLLDKQ